MSTAAQFPITTPRHERYSLNRELIADDTVVIQQGVTQALRINTTIEDPASGWQFHAQIRPSVGSDVVLADWPHGAAEVLPNVVMFSIDPEVSSAWTWREGVVGVEAVSPDGQVFRLIQTHIILSREVVRFVIPQEQEQTNG